MKIFYDYIEEYDLLLIKWTGKWNLVTYKNSIPDFLSFFNDKTIKNVIQDLTDLEFDINFNDFKDFNELLKIRRGISELNYKTVYITSKPQDVVFTSLYSDEFLNEYEYMYCSTYEGALNRLSLKMNFSELEERFNSLKGLN